MRLDPTHREVHVVYCGRVRVLARQAVPHREHRVAVLFHHGAEERREAVLVTEDPAAAVQPDHGPPVRRPDARPDHVEDLVALGPVGDVVLDRRRCRHLDGEGLVRHRVVDPAARTHQGHGCQGADLPELLSFPSGPALHVHDRRRLAGAMTSTRIKTS